MTISYRILPFYEMTLDELYEVLALRAEVFVVEQDCPYQDVDGLDQKAYHLLGRDEEGTLVSYTRLLPKGMSYVDYPAIGRVITSAKIRGKKKGKELMEASIEACDELFGKQSLKISAQSHLEKYYNSVGFEGTGETYLEDGIPHMAMVLKR